MATKARSIAAGEFEARCLALLEEVNTTGEALIVTRHGQPVVKVVPIEKPNTLVGSILWEKDIVSPLDEAWDAES